MKTCRLCGREFPPYTSGPKRLLCPDCKRAQQREYSYMPETREHRRALHAEKVAEARAFVEMLKNNPCTDCGGRFPSVAMDFDHRDPTKKKLGVAQLIGSGYIPLIKAEVEKCDLVCSNCHRIRTYRLKQDGIHRTGGRPRKVRE